MAIGEKIQTLRKQHHLSQEKLAEQLDVSRQAISKWELGESAPETDKIIQLSRVFKISTDYLLLDHPSSKREDPATTSDELENKQPNTVIAIVATGVVLIGLLISIGAQNTYQTIPSVSVGLIVQIAAIVFFETMGVKIDRRSVTRTKFYSLNLWLVLPFPVFYLTQFVFTFYPYSRLYLIDLLCMAIAYLFIGGIMTWILRSGGNEEEPKHL